MLQKYVNRELQDVQAGFTKGRGTRVQETGRIKGRNIKLIKLEMKMERSQQTTQKYKGS